MKQPVSVVFASEDARFLDRLTHGETRNDRWLACSLPGPPGFIPSSYDEELKGGEAMAAAWSPLKSMDIPLLFHCYLKIRDHEFFIRMIDSFKIDVKSGFKHQTV